MLYFYLFIKSVLTHKYMKNKKVIIIAIVVVLIVVASIFSNINRNKNADYSIGAVLSLTGYGAVDGLSIKRGMELAKADLAEDGINVNIIYEDDETNPSKTISAIQKLLISASKPQVMFGPIWSFLVSASLPVIDSANITAYSPSSTSEIAGGISDNMFYGTYKNIESAGAVEDWIKERNIKKLAVVISNDAWGESVNASFIKGAKEAGANIVLTEKINFGADKDVMPTIIAKISKSGAEAVLWTGYDEAGTLLVKKMQEQNLNIPIVAFGSVMKGLVKRGNVQITDKTELYHVNIPLDKKFEEKFIKAYGEVPGVYADSAYDGMMIIAEAMKKTDGSSDEIAKYMKDKVNYDGYLGEYQFDSNGDRKGTEWVIDRLVK